MIVVPSMHLEPNVGSDRSWVWNAAADVSEGEPEASTLAIRFANSESKFRLAMIPCFLQLSAHTFQMPTFLKTPSSRHNRRMRHCSKTTKDTSE